MSLILLNQKLSMQSFNTRFSVYELGQLFIRTHFSKIHLHCRKVYGVLINDSHHMHMHPKTVEMNFAKTLCSNK